MIWLAALGRQAWGWVALLAAGVVAGLTLYGKGYKDARTSAELQALENEVEARRSSNAVRAGVAAAGDAAVDERLRSRWTRAGS
jgi:hypothetical protein